MKSLMTDRFIVLKYEKRRPWRQYPPPLSHVIFKGLGETNSVRVGVEQGSASEVYRSREERPEERPARDGHGRSGREERHVRVGAARDHEGARTRVARVDVEVRRQVGVVGDMALRSGDPSGEVNRDRAVHRELR